MYAKLDTGLPVGFNSTNRLYSRNVLTMPRTARSAGCETAEGRRLRRGEVLSIIEMALQLLDEDSGEQHQTNSFQQNDKKKGNGSDKDILHINECDDKS